MYKWKSRRYNFSQFVRRHTSKWHFTHAHQVDFNVTLFSSSRNRPNFYYHYSHAQRPIHAIKTSMISQTHTHTHTHTHTQILDHNSYVVWNILLEFKVLLPTQRGYRPSPLPCLSPKWVVRGGTAEAQVGYCRSAHKYPPNNNLSWTNTHIHTPPAKHFLWKDESCLVRTLHQAAC